MNVQMLVGLAVLCAVVLAISIELGRIRTQKRKRKRAAIAPPVRRPQLERRMVEAFSGPRRSFGECFTEFSVWRQFDITRMDVKTNDTWSALNTFTRSLVVRHLWRALQRLAHGQVVVSVDAGGPREVMWTADTAFNDHGVAEPWAPAKGRAGTLISGK